MTAHVQDYVASGYFLSRYAGIRDCTGIVCCQLLEPGASKVRDMDTAWLPWLIVRYPL